MLAIGLLALAPVAERVGIAPPPRSPSPGSAHAANRADGDTLDPFALREDKCYVLSEDGSAALAYRYVNGVGLASADPLGNPSAYPEVIETFIERCDANGWRPASIGVRHDRLELWQDAGLAIALPR